jgi:hypothetical protein
MLDDARCESYGWEWESIDRKVRSPPRLIGIGIVIRISSFLQVCETP